jgi:hypothetical protein
MMCFMSVINYFSEYIVMTDKTTTGMSTPTEDLLDQMVAEDRLNQRARKQFYREQLRQDIQQHTRQKEISRLGYKMEL